MDLFFPEARKTNTPTPRLLADDELRAAAEVPKQPADAGRARHPRLRLTADAAKPTAAAAEAEAAAADEGAGTPRRRRRPKPAGSEVASAAAKAAAADAGEQSDARTTAASSGPGDVELVEVPGVRFAEIPVTDIHPNRKQPRSVFDEDDMAELVHSVREIGVLQPIVVRTSTEEGGEPYELVMGERRWRAVQAAGLETIPAIVRDTTDDDLLRDALLENLHRSQLNPLEEAAAYQQLLEDFGTTHEQLADRIGRSRPQVSNTLRLLKLPPLVQRRVAANVISAGHARALLALPDAAAMERLAQKIVSEGMSVRATEEAVTLYQSPASPAKNNIPAPGRPARTAGLPGVVAV